MAKNAYVSEEQVSIDNIILCADRMMIPSCPFLKESASTGKDYPCFGGMNFKDVVVIFLGAFGFTILFNGAKLGMGAFKGLNPFSFEEARVRAVLIALITAKDKVFSKTLILLDTSEVTESY